MGSDIIDSLHDVLFNYDFFEKWICFVFFLKIFLFDFKRLDHIEDSLHLLVKVLKKNLKMQKGFVGFC